MIGAGTNNARLAGLLRSLSSYYYKEPTLLFLVRVAQGLVHMGKGLLTMAPAHTDNQLISGMPPSVLLRFCTPMQWQVIASIYRPFPPLYLPLYGRRCTSG